MKMRIRAALVALGMLLGVCAGAGAEVLAFSPEFELLAAFPPCIEEDGSFVVMGNDVLPEGRVSVLYGVGADGQVDWRLVAEGPQAGQYFGRIFPMGDGEIGVHTTTGPEDPAWISVVKDGGIISSFHRAEPLGDVFGVEGGMLLSYRKSPKAHSTRYLELYDFDFVELWSREYEENWYITEVKETAEGYILCGSYSEAVDMPNQGYVMAMDKTGGIKWQHRLAGAIAQDTGKARQLGLGYAFPQADGSVVVASAASNAGGWSSSYFARVSEAGILWEVWQDYGTEEAPLNANMMAMTQVGDTFYAVYIVGRVQDALHLMEMDGAGQVLRRWEVAVPEIRSVSGMHLIPGAEGLRLLVNGYVESSDAYKEKATVLVDVEGDVQ